MTRAGSRGRPQPGAITMAAPDGPRGERWTGCRRPDRVVVLGRRSLTVPRVPEPRGPATPFRHGKARTTAVASGREPVGLRGSRRAVVRRRPLAQRRGPRRRASGEPVARRRARTSSRSSSSVSSDGLSIGSWTKATSSVPPSFARTLSSPSRCDSSSSTSTVGHARAKRRMHLRQDRRADALEGADVERPRLARRERGQVGLGGLEPRDDRLGVAEQEEPARLGQRHRARAARPLDELLARRCARGSRSAG